MISTVSGSEITESSTRSRMSIWLCSSLTSVIGATSTEIDEMILAA